MYNDTRSANPHKVALRMRTVVHFAGCERVASLPALTLQDATSEERLMALNGTRISVFEGNSKRKKQVKEQALNANYLFYPIQLGESKHTFDILKDHDGWNLDLCCSPDSFFRAFNSVFLLTPEALRLTFTGAARVRSRYMPFGPPSIHDKDAAVALAKQIAEDVVIHFGGRLQCTEVVAYPNKQSGQGRFWMFYMLFRKEVIMTKMQKAAHKAWATRRANAKRKSNSARAKRAWKTRRANRVAFITFK